MDQSVCPACGSISHTMSSKNPDGQSTQVNEGGIVEAEQAVEQDGSVKSEETIRPAPPQLLFGIDHAPFPSKQESLPFGLEHAPESSRE